MLPTIWLLAMLTLPERISIENGELMMLSGDNIVWETGRTVVATSFAFAVIMDSQYRPEMVGMYST